jgi:Ser/Thr protein kinase RdoA (MazF antagonist)
MDKKTKDIIQHAEKLYNAKLISENSIGNSANQVYEMLADRPVILRVSEYTEKKKNHIDFELEWMDYLSQKINNIVQPISSVNDNLLEIIICDKKYILCVFEKAKGHMLDIRNIHEYNKALFLEIGLLMARIHNMTKNYSCHNNSISDEFAWYNGWSFWSEYNLIIDDEVSPYEKKYIQELYSLPKSSDTYGIIHADIQWANFFIDNGHITLFDFDDCEFNWYAYDMAITLYQFVQQSGIPHTSQKERADFAETFLLSYLKGYIQENTIDKNHILQLDMFMKYRRITTYKFIQNVFNVKTVNPHLDYMNWLKKEILLDNPFVEINYEKIIDKIFK